MPIPTHGQVIRFTKVPTGSYASAGTDYRVNVGKRDVRLHNIATGGATSDPKYTYAKAEWEAV